jgi:hypothetical protein
MRHMSKLACPFLVLNHEENRSSYENGNEPAQICENGSAGYMFEILLYHIPYLHGSIRSK